MVPGLLLAQPCGKGLSAPRQPLGGKREAQIILADIDEIDEALDKPQCDQDIGKNADPDPGIPFFEAGEGTG